MSRIFLLIVFLFSLNKIAIAKDNEFSPDDLFHIDQMNSHNKDFALYFKGRENSILARGENENYINDYPKDLYIYDYKPKTSLSFAMKILYNKRRKTINNNILLTIKN